MALKDRIKQNKWKKEENLLKTENSTVFNGDNSLKNTSLSNSLETIEQFYNDNEVSEIIVKGVENIEIVKNATPYSTKVKFSGELQLQNFVENLFISNNQVIEDKSKINSVKLSDGTRITAMLPPLTEKTCISIQKVDKRISKFADLIKSKFLTEDISAFLEYCFTKKINILIMGGQSSGKTTLMNAFIKNIQKSENVIFSQKYEELNVFSDNCIELDVSNSAQLNILGLQAFRPDRIMFSDCNAMQLGELVELSSMGIKGILASVEALNFLHVISILKTYFADKYDYFEETAINSLIASSVDLIIQVSRLCDGSYKLISLSEFSLNTKKDLTVQNIISLNESTANYNFISSGLLPKFVEHNELSKYNLPADFFEKDRVHTLLKDENCSAIDENLEIKNNLGFKQKKKSSIRSRLKTEN